MCERFVGEIPVYFKVGGSRNSRKHLQIMSMSDMYERREGGQEDWVRRSSNKVKF